MKSDMQIRQEISHLRKQLRERKRKAHGLGPRKKGMGCRIGDRDEAAMEARKFLDKGSYIRRDGSEKLVGLDWAAREEELAKRSGRRCEFSTPIEIGEYARCNSFASDPHHKIKRSIRRDDRMSNLQHLCRFHHNLLDARKPQWTPVRSGKVGA